MSLIVLFVATGLLTFFLTPYLRDFFIFLQLVDEPDGARRLHAHPVPRIGGISILIAFIVGLVLTVALIKLPPSGTMPALATRVLLSLIPGAVIVFATGLIDDIIGISPWQKLAGQAAAGALAYAAGIRMLPHGTLPEWQSALLTVLWLMFCANAFNLVDGLDGLSAGVSFIAAAALMLIAILNGFPLLAVAIVPYLGSVAGFLFHNANPATIFLGDCGSLLLGFLYGCFALLWVAHAGFGLSGAAPLLAMALPAAEILVSIARRLLRLRHPFAADRNHIHHRLLLLGLNIRNAALTLWTVSATAAVVAVTMTIANRGVTVILLSALTASFLVALRALRYEEFAAVPRWLLGGDALHALRLRISMQEYQSRLQSATSHEEQWAALSETARAAQFDQVELITPFCKFQTLTRTLSTLPQHTVRIALEQGGTLRIAYGCDRPELSMWVAPLALYLDQSLARLRSGDLRAVSQTRAAVGAGD